MNTQGVDRFLPHIGDAQRGRAPMFGGSESSQSFDSFLNSANMEQQPLAKRRQPQNESAASETTTQPKTQQKEQSDRPDKEPENRPADEAPLKIIAVDVPIPVLFEQTVETKLSFEQPEQHIELIPVEVFDQETEAADALLEDVEPEFELEMQTAEAEEAVELETRPAVETEVEHEEASESEQTISLDRQASISVTRDNSAEPKEDVDAMEIQESLEVEALAPAAPEDTSGENRQADLAPGDQMNVEVRQAGAAPQASGNSEIFTVNDVQVVEQVVQGASLINSDGRSEVRIQLSPPELGSVRLAISSDSSRTVDATIIVEREEVRDLIERNIAQLREQLQAAGVSVGEFDVSTQQFDQSASDYASDNQRTAWDGAGEQDADVQADRPLGVNRSTSDGAIDYLV